MVPLNLMFICTGASTLSRDHASILSWISRHFDVCLRAPDDCVCGSYGPQLVELVIATQSLYPGLIVTLMSVCMHLMIVFMEAVARSL